ncbi:MAG: hypothetical protein ACE5FU_14110 [Nitrospinota bacterium]
MEFIQLLTHIAIQEGKPYLLLVLTLYFSYTAMKVAATSLLFRDLKKGYTEELIRNTTELYNQFQFEETEKK